jgi:hypothetical protein
LDSVPPYTIAGGLVVSEYEVKEAEMAPEIPL